MRTDAQHNAAGYRGLVAGIVLQAFKDLRMMSSAEGHNPKALRDKAWAWIHDPVTYAPDETKQLVAYRSQDVGGYLWCCSILDLDPEFYRQLSTTRAGINALLGKHGNNQYATK